MLKHFKKTFSLIILFLALACQKQSVPEIEKDFKTVEEQRRLETCSQVDLTNNILDHYNVQLLFQCMRWDKEFPALFESLTKVQRVNWNHMMMPVNDAILKNHSVRDRFFRNIRELDSKNGLDDLSFVLTALNETNFFDATKDLFDCVNDPTLEKCEKRQGRIPKKTELLKILDILGMDTKVLKYSSNFIKLLIEAYSNNKEPIREEVLKFIKVSDFIKFRLRLIDTMAQKGMTGMSAQDRSLLTKLLLVGNKETVTPWLYSWLHDERLGYENFSYILTYAFQANPNVINDYRALEDIYYNGVNCDLTGVNTDYAIDFNIPNQLNNYAQIIVNKGYDDLLHFFSKDIPGLMLLIPACPQLITNKYNSNIVNTANKALNLVTKPIYYDLFKFIFSQTNLPYNPQNKFGENFYILDFISDPFFQDANLLGAEMIKHAPKILPLTYQIIYDLDKQAFIDLGRVSDILLQEKNDEIIKGLALLWNFYTEEEKNFLFNFIDRHFENQTDYVALFEFYSRMMDDSIDLIPALKKAWIEGDDNREASYLSLQDVLSNLAGEKTLTDFKKFFSRNQIIKILEILSNGVQLNEEAKSELRYMYTDTYIDAIKNEPYEFKLLMAGNRIQNKDYASLISCLDSFTTGKTFYELARSISNECKSVQTNYFGVRLYKWMGDFHKTYFGQFPSNNFQESILDEEGLFSPLLLNTNLGFSKLLDSTLGQGEAHKSGLIYVLDKLHFYLYNFKFYESKTGLDLGLSTLDWLMLVDDQFKNNLETYRISLLKEWSEEKNFSRTSKYLRTTSSLFDKYASWLKNGQYLKSKHKTYAPLNPEYTCEKFVNLESGPYNCPSKEQVKFHLANVINTMSTVWEPKNGSPIGQVLKSFKNFGGKKIPFQGKKQRTYYLTLDESIRSVFDMTDKSLPVNKTKVTLVNEKNKTITPVLTTMERVETVIREVRFENNYIGVAYLNYVVAAESYNDEVKNRKMLFSACVKVPGVRCGKKMSDSDLRMAKNAVETYDGLLDANNGRGKEPRLTYGNYLSTFQQALIESSATGAQERQLLPLSSDVLKKHNGTILADLSLMAGFSNFGRFLRSRVATNRTELNAFLNRKDVKKVDEAMLRGFNAEKTIPVAEKLLKRLLVKNSKDKKSLLDLSVDWFAGLSYQDSRRVEETLAKMVAIGSYLGTPKQVFGDNSQSAEIEEMNERYKDNNLYDLFITLDKIFDLWPQLEKTFPQNARLVDFFKEISPIVDFLHQELFNANTASNEVAYKFVNDSYIVLKELLFETRRQTMFANKIREITGIDIITSVIKSDQLLTKFVQLVREHSAFVAKIQEEDGENRLKILAKDIGLVLNHPKLEAEGYRLYLENSTKSLKCKMDSTQCAPNYHYDEPMKLVRYLGSKGDTGEIRLKTISYVIFKEDKFNIDDFIKTAFSSMVLE